MKQINAIFSLVCLMMLSVACSKDSSSKSAIEGKWKLTYWGAEVPMDLNNDGFVNVNLLKETTCPNHEILSFDSNGVVSSEDTFNPNVMIAELIDEASSSYDIQIECAEGVIGFAMDYSYDNTNGNVQIGETTTATINEGLLTIVYGGAVEIYNAELTEVVATKDLTKVYTKQ